MQETSNTSNVPMRESSIETSMGGTQTLRKTSFSDTNNSENNVFNGNVNTKIACLSCRDKKLKCDKLLPKCTRCKNKGIECVYLSHKKTGPKPFSRSKLKPEVLNSIQHNNFSGYDSNLGAGPEYNANHVPNPSNSQNFMISQPKRQKILGPGVSSPSSSSTATQYQPLLDFETPNDAGETKYAANDNIINHSYHQLTCLNDITNDRFEEALGLKELGLTMLDIDKFHAFYFNSNIRIFKYSVSRYYTKLVEDPKSVLHYSYMIWTIACFYLDEYESSVNLMYEKALERLTSYWESTRDSLHADIITYLHALCIKSQFEFMSGKEMRAALTVSLSIRLTQMFGYDQIDLSPNTLATPAIFFRSFSVSANPLENKNGFQEDDHIDPEIPLVEERRRVLWEVYAIDKWSSLVTGLPCAFSVDNHSVIFTKLPSPTTFLPLHNDSDTSEPDNDQSSYYLHEAMQKLDKNQVLIDLNSSSSKILLLTISENIIKWCKMFLNMVELDSLKSDNSIDSIRHKVDELVRNFESMHNNLLFFDLTTEPLMNIVITNTITLLYQSVLIKFGSLFDLQFKEDPTGGTISEKEKSLFRDILHEVSLMSQKIIQRFVKKPQMDSHLKKAPVFIVFINSIKSLFQCAAFLKRFEQVLDIDADEKNLLLLTIDSASSYIDSRPNTAVVNKIQVILKNGHKMLRLTPQLLSFFDSFFDSARTY